MRPPDPDQPAVAPPHSGDPAEEPRRGTAVDGEHVLGALSPTAVAEFRDCALRYRLRRIDRLPEPPSPAALRGTLVHLVLERLYDLPAAERVPQRAEAMVPPAWESLAQAEPALAALVPAEELEDWLAPCRAAVAAYFDLEDPRLVEPAERELYVETLLGSRLLLRGVLDRLDVDASGALRVVDYKSGRSPGVGFEQRALAQLRFYALVLWRSRGVVPQELRLVYLGDSQTLTYSPDEGELLATERVAEAVFAAVQEASLDGSFEPSPGRTCQWCSFQQVCPAYGGTLPPWPGADAGPDVASAQVERHPAEVVGTQPEQ